MARRQTLDDLIALFTPEIRDAFLAAIQGIVDDAIIDDVIKAIQDGDPAGAFQALGFSQAALRPITAAIERAFETGGVLTGGTFPNPLRTPTGRAVFRFDVRNSRAEAWLRDHSSTLVDRITEEQRQITRTTLERGMLEGRNPRSVANNLVGVRTKVIMPDGTAEYHRQGGVIGLSPFYEDWVNSARNKLVNLDPSYLDMKLRNSKFDSVVERAIKDGRPLPPETVDKLVNAYRVRTLKYRGESIARTEAMQALNQSEYEAVLQAVDIGALRRQDVQRHWDSASDTRVRFSHSMLDKKYEAKGVGVDEPFVSPVTGARMMHPGDTSLGAPADEVVMCRCRVRMKVDFLSQWND